MNTLLDALDDTGNIYKISVDMNYYDVEQIDEFTCLISHKIIEDKAFEVMHDFMYLHLLSNGFNSSIMN